ncbi:MAG: hypothetical protein M0R73_02890 [Dehalococcoidia bacterium]|nr:hypothetical protein [Dehalococcoidia bacterium]
MTYYDVQVDEILLNRAPRGLGDVVSLRLFGHPSDGYLDAGFREPARGEEYLFFVVQNPDDSYGITSFWGMMSIERSGQLRFMDQSRTEVRLEDLMDGDLGDVRTSLTSIAALSRTD